MLIDAKLSAFVEMVAAKTPTPGGGSVSAAACAMGTALGVMTARFSEGPGAAEAAEKLEPIKEEFVRLIDADAAAYDRVDAALGLPKKEPGEKTRRREALQSALKEAAEVPLQGMRTAVRSLEALQGLSLACNKNLASDLGSAALMLEAGLLGCSLNVKANTKALVDREVAVAMETEAGRLIGEAGRLRGEILKTVESMYGGK
jgi:glutamate formiminotransferase / formiminotetrahydrofolate cyclodeaminase